MKHKKSLIFEPFDNNRIAILAGSCDENLRAIEKHFNIKVLLRGNQIRVFGDDFDHVSQATNLIEKLYQESAKTNTLNPLELLSNSQPQKQHHQPVIKTMNDNQKAYIDTIHKNTITFGLGPAGTGKTYLAVSYAVNALLNNQFKRLIITRPVVEAGEKLGYLPGDLAQKIDPYMRPIFDALSDILSPAVLQKWQEQNRIEIAPLAYMRGRTLNKSFILLDEAQNTTKEQMKMILTRIGRHSKMVITGDQSQVDLSKQHEILSKTVSKLNDIDGIDSFSFTINDVVRHSIVQQILRAYEQK